MAAPREDLSPNGRIYRSYTRRDLAHLPQLQVLSPARRRAMQAVATVLPFRANAYVVEELIDWDRIPDDPLFQLSFPQPGMLPREARLRMESLLARSAPPAEVLAAARAIQAHLNPHPGGQKQLNVPRLDGTPVPGMQHKYRETLLFFPTQGQTCHAYCSYCFRWPQFVGSTKLRFASTDVELLVRYVRAHPEISSVLITGGDPLTMKTEALRRYIEPLLDPSLEHLHTIRIGTKAPAWWPYRFTTEADADDLLRLFERVRGAGLQLALMAHFSHPRELSTSQAREALRRVQDAGAVVRCQGPLVRHVNDRASIWAELWEQQVHLGAVPYYMFVERDTGPHAYFSVPLARALRIYQGAQRACSGLARTARGPSMSTTPGKILVDGVADVGGERVFVLKFLQARNPEWVGRPFFARYDERALWLEDLRPAFGRDTFFFEKDLARADPIAGDAFGSDSGGAPA